MTDLVVTATSVLPGSDSVVENGLCGETIAAGKAVYKAAATGVWWLADSNSATAEARTAWGVALNGGAVGQPVRVHKSGDLTFNAIFTANIAYYLSDTPGGICPIADVGSGEYLCQIGIAKSTTVLAVNIQATGVPN